MSKTCEVCGTEFIPNKHRPNTAKTCSQECCKELKRIRHKEWWKKNKSPKLEPKFCPICKKQFQPRARNKVTCSFKCSEVYRNQLQKDRCKGKLRPGKHKRICKICNHSFQGHKAALICDSRECLLESRRRYQRKQHKCQVCKKEFEGKGQGVRLYCSKRCSNVAYKRKYTEQAKRTAKQNAERWQTDPEYRSRRREATRRCQRRKASVNLLVETNQLEQTLGEKL